MVLTAVVAALAVVALTAQGFPPAQTDLNDGGVWVVNRSGSIGLIAQYVPALEEQRSPVVAGDGDKRFDVLQSGSRTLVVRPDSGAIANYDVASSRLSPGVAIPPGSLVRMGGPAGSEPVVAILSPEGKLWALPWLEVAGFDADKREPVRDDLAAGADASVASDGSVVAASPGLGLVRLAPGALAGPGEVTAFPAGFGEPDTAVSVTSVGSSAVVLDSTGQVLLPGGDVARVPTTVPAPVLQQSGPDASAVLVSTGTGLVQINLGSGELARVGQSVEAVSAEQTLPAPIVMPGDQPDALCAYAIFPTGGTIDQLSTCREGFSQLKTQTGGPWPGGTADLTYRVNRSEFVLNDAATGAVWNPTDDELVQRDDWTEPKDDKPTTKAKDSAAPPENKKCTIGSDSGPSPEDDVAGVRIDQPSVIDVLANDGGNTCDVLTIRRITSKLASDELDVQIVDSGRKLQVLAHTGARGTYLISYEVDNGRKGGVAPAKLTVSVVDSGNRAPKLKLGTTTVAAGQSVSYAVLGDVVDPDGDPVQLIAAQVPEGQGSVRFQPDGLLTYFNGGSVGKVKVQVVVSDGRKDGTAQGYLTVVVRSNGDDLAPTARPDFVAGIVGTEMELDLLANDYDPRGSELVLTAVKPVEASPAVFSYEESEDGVVRATAKKAGSFVLRYTLTAGGKSAEGVARFVVVEPQAENSDPVAQVDVVSVRLGGSSSVDVLANDSDADGDVLAVTSARSAEPAVTVSVAAGRWVRVQLVGELTRPVVVSYEVTDGRGDPVTGSIVVSQVSSASTDQLPVARPDSVAVRAGSAVTIPVLANDLAGPSGALVLVRDLPIPPKAGTATTNGTGVRYVAPPAPGQYGLDYAIADASNPTLRDVGHVNIQVIPADATNRAPRPQPVQARAVKGAKGGVEISVPLEGIDPDGDPVYLNRSIYPSADFANSVEVDTASQSIIYRAETGRTGTDRLTYEVCDVAPNPKCGTGLLEVVVYERTTNEPPIAVPDAIVLSPGRTAAVNVLANDTDPDGEKPQFADDALVVPAGFRAEVRGDTIRVTAPTKATQSDITYRIVDDAHKAAPVSGLLNVTVSETARKYPPIAVDDVVEASGVSATATVPVLDNDSDPDGTTDALTLSTVPGFTGVRLTDDGRQLVVERTSAARMVPYSVTDEDGNPAMAWVIVPAAGNAPPKAKPVELSVPAGGKLTLKVSELAVDPEGGDVYIADSTRLRPVGALTATSKSDLVFQAPGGDGTPIEQIPSRVTLTIPVTDSPSTTPDPASIVPVSVSVRIDIDHPPVFTPVSLDAVREEIEPVTYDLSASVTDDDPADAGAAKEFTPIQETVGQAKGARVDIMLDRDGRLRAVPAGGSQLGTVVVPVTVRVGALEATAEVTITVRDTRRAAPDAQDIALERLDVGSSLEVDLLRANTDPFQDQVDAGDANARMQVTDVRVKTGSVQAAIGAEGVVTLSAPAEAAPMLADVQYTLTDKAQRTSTAVITVPIWGKPSDPQDVRASVATGTSVDLKWTGSKANTYSHDPDAQDLWYTVTYPGMSATARASLERVKDTQVTVPDLVAGQRYVFTVVAWNSVGASAPATGEATPDAFPLAPALSVSSDPADFDSTYVTLLWDQAEPDGGASPLVRYDVTYSPAASGATSALTAVRYGTAGNRARLDGLVQGRPYQVTVCGVNAESETKGTAPSSCATVGVRAIGLPTAPTGLNVTNLQDPVNQGVVTATWSALSSAATGGDPELEYICRLYDSSNRSTPVDSTTVINATSCAMSGATPGTTYVVTVTTRSDKGDSPTPAESAPVDFRSQPAAVTNITATPTTTDRGVNIKYSALTGAATGCGSCATRYEWSLDGSSWTVLGTQTAYTVSVPQNGVAYTIHVRGNNALAGPGSGLAGPDAVAPNTVTAFGLPTVGGIGVGHPSATSVSFAWSATANGRPAVVDYQLNGGAWTRLATSSGPTNTNAMSGTITAGNGYSQSYSFVVRICDDQSNCPQTSATASTNPPPPPPPSVAVVRGPQLAAPVASCSAGWWRVNVSLRNFTPNTSVPLELWGRDASGWGPWVTGKSTGSVNVDGNGNYDGQVNLTGLGWACAGSGQGARWYANGPTGRISSADFTF